MSEQLITKYRPIAFEEVIGNKLVIDSLSAAVNSESRPHGYLFTGPSGIGKTTLARIIANSVDAFVNEICAAVESGVDDTRRVVDAAGYKPIMGQKNILCIIDESHNLSKKAWEPLLKLIEDPPPYFYMALCSTEPLNIPPTIKNRCYHVALKALKPFDIEDLLLTVCELEGWTLDNSVLQGMVQAADGSARKALSILQAGHALKSRDELALVIAQVDSEENPAFKLAQYLVKGGRNWREIIQLSKGIEDEEEAIQVMSRYFIAVMMKSEEQQAQDMYRMIRSFTEVTLWDKKIQFYTSLGKILWGQIPF